MSSLRYRAAALLLCLSGTAASAQDQPSYLSWAPASPAETIFRDAVPPAALPGDGDDAAAIDRQAEVPDRLRRQVVPYSDRHAAGTIVIDTPHTYLYYVLGNGRAIRYGIGVGREGFTWSGTQPVSRKAEWPDWSPPSDMIARQPYLPRFMAGGPGNPLGARAIYLGNTAYRIHGTNAPDSIGQRVSSGCIRMLNEDVMDLYARVKLGAKVVVLPAGHAPALAKQRHESSPPRHGAARNDTMAGIY